jgi:hypothetical protein
MKTMKRISMTRKPMMIILDEKWGGFESSDGWDWQLLGSLDGDEEAS